MKKVAILWAWPAWMAAAYELSKHEWYQIDIYERATQVWWMAWSIDYNWQRVDFWPHRFFSKLDMPNELWDEVLWEDSVQVKRLTRMFYQGKYYNYPIDLGNVVRTMPFLKLCKIWLSYLRAKVFPIKDDSNYENRVINNFWRELYMTFFKNYNEKLRWVSGQDLGSDRVKQRIRWVSVMNIIKKRLFGKTKNQIKSWVDQFKYPKFGNGFFYERIKEIILERWVTLLLNTSISSISYENDKWLVNGTHYDDVVSSIPLTLFFKLFDKTPIAINTALAQLKFRNIILIYATIDKTDLFPDNRIYLHSPSVQAGRLTNFNNRSPYQIMDHSKTFVVLEYRDNDDGELRNATDSKLMDLAHKDLVNITWLDESKIGHFKIIRLPFGYPIYTKGYEDPLEQIIAFTKSLSWLQLIGRSWAFKYNNQDHSLYMWYLSAKNILWADYNLRTVNADEEYQEE